MKSNMSANSDLDIAIVKPGMDEKADGLVKS